MNVLVRELTLTEKQTNTVFWLAVKSVNEKKAVVCFILCSFWLATIESIMLCLCLGYFLLADNSSTSGESRAHSSARGQFWLISGLVQHWLCWCRVLMSLSCAMEFELLHATCYQLLHSAGSDAHLYGGVLCNCVLCSSTTRGSLAWLFSTVPL